MEGPDCKSIKYESSSTAWISNNKTSNNLKDVHLSKFFNQITEFYFNRKFNNFTYCPVIVCLFDLEDNTNSINNFIENFQNKYFYFLKKPDSKFCFGLEKNDDFNKLSKDYFYTISFDDTITSNIIIDKNMPDFVINQILLELKDRCGGIFIIFSNKYLELFFNTSARTYSDLIIFDKTYNFLNEMNNLLSSIRLQANLKFKNNFLIFDKTTNWIDIKVINE